MGYLRMHNLRSDRKIKIFGEIFFGESPLLDIWKPDSVLKDS